jgi:hypothetical protein
LIIDAYYHSLYAKTLTGVRYVKHVYGPVPDADAHKILYEMEFGKVLVKHERKGEYIQNSHYAAVEPDYSALPPEAPEIIEEVAGMISKFSAADLSNLTHNEAWNRAEYGEAVPIKSAYFDLVVDGAVRALSGEEEAEFERELEDLYAGNEFAV